MESRFFLGLLPHFQNPRRVWQHWTWDGYGNLSEILEIDLSIYISILFSRSTNQPNSINQKNVHYKRKLFMLSEWVGGESLWFGRFRTNRTPSVCCEEVVGDHHLFLILLPGFQCQQQIYRIRLVALLVVVACDPSTVHNLAVSWYVFGFIISFLLIASTRTF